MKPNRGLILDKYQLLVFKMTPKEKKTLTHKFECRLNDSDKHCVEVAMLGSSEQPDVVMDTQVCTNNRDASQQKRPY